MQVTYKQVSMRVKLELQIQDEENKVSEEFSTHSTWAMKGMPLVMLENI
jgi:hypothetical protein